MDVTPDLCVFLIFAFKNSKTVEFRILTLVDSAMISDKGICRVEWAPVTSWNSVIANEGDKSFDPVMNSLEEEMTTRPVTLLENPARWGAWEGYSLCER